MDKHTVCDENGSVDVSASMTAYGEALTKWVASNEIAADTIEVAVNAAFDKFPGKRLPMPVLLANAVAELSATPEQHASLTKRVHSYVRAQATAGKLFISKGKNGGVGREAPVKKDA